MSRHIAIPLLVLLAGLAGTAAVHAGVNHWTSNGPAGGFVGAVAMDPSDPDTLYAAVFRGRIFKTTDAGGSWNELTRLGVEVLQLVAAPSDSAVVYAATELGIFRTADAGGTWEGLRTGIGTPITLMIAIDPLNPNTLYAGTSTEGPGGTGGVFKSTDGGSTWARSGLTDFTVAALAVAPSNPNVVHAATIEGGVFKSTDAGASWPVEDQRLADRDVRALAVVPSVPGVVYAGTWDGVVFKSVDAGSVWAGTELGGGPIRTLAVDPLNPNTLYAGTRSGGVVRSLDAGATWSAAGVGLTAPDVRSLAVHPWNPNIVYAATFGGAGLHRTTDAAATWAVRNQGVNATIVTTVAVDPLNPNTVYAGSAVEGVLRSRGLFKSTDAGSTWKAASEDLADVAVRDLAVDPVNPNVLYAGTLSGVFKSFDAGLTWQAAGDGLTSLDVRVLAIDPLNRNTVFAATAGGIFKSTDAGATWTAVNDGLTDLTVDALVIDPSNPNVVYAGGRVGVFRSADSGHSWSAVSLGVQNPIVRDLAIDPSDSATLYAATLAGVFRSTDGAASWFRFTGEPMSVESIAIDPSRPTTLWAGTVFHGVWKSEDSGRTWTNHPRGLEDIPVLDLVVDPATPNRLYAGTSTAAVSEITEKADSLAGRVWHDTDADGLRDAGEGGVQSVSVFLLDEALELVGIATTDADGLYRFPYQRPGNYVIEVEVPQGFLVSPADQGADTVDSDVDATGRTGLLVLTEDNVVVADAGLFRPASIGGRVWSDLDGDGLQDPEELSFAGVEVRLRSPDSSIELASDTLDSGTYGFGGLVPGRYRLRFVAPEGVLFSPQDQGEDDTIDSDTDAAGLTGLIVVRSGDEVTVDAGLAPEEEEPEATTVLEVQDGRFTVEVEWSDFQGETGLGTLATVPDGEAPVALRSQDSAVIEFFGPNNWEVLLKVLDGRVLNNRFWVFFAAATNVGFTIQVSDTSCGDTKSYTNPSGVAAPAVTDTSAFPGCAEPLAPSCEEDEDTLCLGESGRFRVRIGWSDFSGNTGFGRQVLLADAGQARSEDSGLFYFFSEDNWEILVKVLDGCGINNHFWVFSAATTNVRYALKVTDRVSGEVRTYENPLGTAADALNDTAAFATCGGS